MSSRLRTVTIAIAFGLLGTLGVAVYVNSVKAAIVESGAKQDVFVAAAEVPAGTDIAKAAEEGLLVKAQVPKRYTADTVIKSLDDYKGQITIASISRGEQLTAGKLRPADQSEVAYRLDPGKIAVSIPVDEVTGVGGEIKTGDHVVVLATFTPGPGGVDLSRVLLTGVEVLAAGGEGRGGAPAASQKRTITLALTPADAEKLVFAEEKGKVWIGLAPVKPQDAAPTGGQTIESVFK